MLAIIKNPMADLRQIYHRVSLAQGYSFIHVLKVVVLNCEWLFYLPKYGDNEMILMNLDTVKY